MELILAWEGTKVGPWLEVTSSNVMLPQKLFVIILGLVNAPFFIFVEQVEDGIEFGQCESVLEIFQAEGDGYQHFIDVVHLESGQELQG